MQRPTCLRSILIFLIVGCNLGPADVASIAAAAATNTSLLGLVLVGNDVGEHGANKLLDMIFNDNVSLLSLDVCGWHGDQNSPVWADSGIEVDSFGWQCRINEALEERGEYMHELDERIAMATREGPYAVKAAVPALERFREECEPGVDPEGGSHMQERRRERSPRERSGNGPPTNLH